MELAILLIGGVSSALFLWAIYGMLQGRKEKPGNEEQRFEVEKAPLALMALLPVSAVLAAPLKIYEKRLRAAGAKSDHVLLQLMDHISRSLVTAGNPGGIRPEEMLAASLVSSVGFAAVFFAISAAAGYPVGLFTFTALVIGLAVPMIWLSDRVKRRQLVIRNDLPYMLDILTLCIEAGLDFTTALARIIPKFSGSPLGYEMAAVLRDIQVGKARSDSLRDLAWRLNLSEVTTVVNAIIQAERLGTSTGPSMRIQADEARRRRSLRAEELALKAPVKLLFPLVAFIFPTTFLILFAPVFIKNLPLLSRLTK